MATLPYSIISLSKVYEMEPQHRQCISSITRDQDLASGILNKVLDLADSNSLYYLFPQQRTASKSELISSTANLCASLDGTIFNSGKSLQYKMTWNGKG